jgi:hypothetical protein
MIPVTTSDLQATESRRITLTVDAGSYSPATIDIAVAMAASMNATLQGFFIEDADLLHMADLPCSVEVVFPSAQQRRLNSGTLRQQLRQLGAQAREYLAHSAQRANVQWSFTQMSGKGSEAGLVIANASDHLIISRASRHPPPQHKPYAMRILLVGDHSPALLAALRALLQQMQTTAMEIVLVGAGGEGEGSTVAIDEMLRDAPHVRLSRLRMDALEEMITLQAISSDYVIVSRCQPLQFIEKLVRESSCPVILLA